MSQTGVKGSKRSPRGSRPPGQKKGGPEYKDKPQGVVFAVWDLQGSPIPDHFLGQLETTILAMVKASGINSLAIDVKKG